MFLLFVRYFLIITDQAAQQVEEEIKVKCPCGNDEVLVISHFT